MKKDRKKLEKMLPHIKEYAGKLLQAAAAQTAYPEKVLEKILGYYDKSCYLLYLQPYEEYIQTTKESQPDIFKRHAKIQTAILINSGLPIRLDILPAVPKCLERCVEGIMDPAVWKS